MGDPIAAKGTKLYRRTGVGPDVYTKITNVTQVTGPSAKMGKVYTDDLDSTVKTNRPTILDPGNVNLELNFIPDEAQHTAMQTSFYAGTVERWKMEFVDGTACIFPGFLEEFTPAAESNEANLTGTASISVTDVCTWVPAP